MCTSICVSRNDVKQYDRAMQIKSKTDLQCHTYRHRLVKRVMQLPLRLGIYISFKHWKSKKNYELALITKDFLSFKSTLGQDSVPHAIAEIA